MAASGTGNGRGRRAWHLDGPDADGHVWFHWEGESAPQRFNLGEASEVGERLADFLARIDFAGCT